MFFFTEEQAMFKKAVNEFVEREAPREKTREWDTKEEFPVFLYKKMAELGWTGLSIPEEYGGLGRDAVFVTILNEGLAKYSFDIAMGFAFVNWGAMNVVRFGTEQQKRYYLPRVIAGEVRFSPSFTEPEAGSDLGSLTTTAARRNGYYVINGQKIFNSGADIPNNVLTVAARTDKSLPKHKGITLFFVDNQTPGVTIRRLNLLGRRIIGVNEVFYDEVKVPEENMIGGLNRGWEVMLSQIETERINAGTGYMGNAQTAVNDAIEYAKQRVQFGQPIGKFQAIRHMLANMQTEVDAARLLLYRVAWMIKENLPCAKEASMAKLFSSEVFQRVTSCGVQIMGGYGLTAEQDMQRYFRDSRAATIGGGTSEIQRDIIARGLGL